MDEAIWGIYGRNRVKPKVAGLSKKIPYRGLLGKFGSTPPASNRPNVYYGKTDARRRKTDNCKIFSKYLTNSKFGAI